MYFKMKIMVFFLGIIFIALVLCPFVLRKRQITISLAGSDSEAALYFPNLWASVFGSHCHLSAKEPPYSGHAGLLYAFFEAPILMASLSHGTIICLYDFDVSTEVIVFELQTDTESVRPLTGSLSHIVQNTSWGVRQGTDMEVSELVDRIKIMSDKEYRQASVPSIDLGFLRVYRDRIKVLDRLMLKVNVPKDTSFIN